MTQLTAQKLPARVRVAIDGRDIDAIRTMANEYRHGIGVRKNRRVAFALFRAGAELRDAESAWHVADAFEYGEGAPKSATEAERYLELAVRLGSVGATTALGELRWRFAKSDSDRKKAIALYRRAARAGEPHALHNLGVCYSSGTGVRKNVHAAFEYFLLAAEKGHTEAEFKVGWCLLHGEGILQNKRRAFHWLRRAARSGNAYASRLLERSAEKNDRRAE